MESKNHDNMIDPAKNHNLTIHKFLHFHPYNDNLNIGCSDKDQELLHKLKLPNLMKKAKSKSLTPPANPSESSTNIKKLAMEIPHINLDRS
jgi:hypothetical protein